MGSLEHMALWPWWNNREHMALVEPHGCKSSMRWLWGMGVRDPRIGPYVTDIISLTHVLRCDILRRSIYGVDPSPASFWAISCNSL